MVSLYIRVYVVCARDKNVIFEFNNLLACTPYPSLIRSIRAHAPNPSLIRPLRACTPYLDLPIINTCLCAFTLIHTFLKVNLHQVIFVHLSLSAIF